MESNRVKLGSLIKPVSQRNSKGLYSKVLGVSIDKEFMPSVANIIGTDLNKYNVVSKGVFACNPMHVGRDEVLPVALYKEEEPSIVSPAYFMFAVKDENVIISDFLLLIFKNPLFDHICWFHTDASVRGGLTWDDFCNLEIVVPSIEEQKKILCTVNALDEEIKANASLIMAVKDLEKCIFNKFYANNTFDFVNINSLFTIKYGKGLPTSELVPDGYPVFGGNGKIGFYKKYMYDLPQILVSCRGAASGNVVISSNKSFVTSNSLVLEMSDYSFFNFYRLYFSANPFYEFVTGSAQPQITIDNLADVKIPNANVEGIDDLLRSLTTSYDCLSFLNKKEELLFLTKRILISSIL